MDGDGTVTLYTNDTITIAGRFVAGRLNGPATENGDHLHVEGIFKDGKLEGFGKQRWGNGGSYEGGFHQGKYEGQGTLVLADGSYTGSFHAGQFSGHGTRIYWNGSSVEGSFTNGEIAGSGVYRMVDGKLLKGEIVPPKPDPAIAQPVIVYPPTSVRLNHQGDTSISTTVAADGTLKSVRLVESSGFKELDDVALAIANSLHVLPATVNGKPVEMEFPKVYRFRLH